MEGVHYNVRENTVKHITEMPQYKTECMLGAPHPVLPEAPWDAADPFGLKDTVQVPLQVYERVTVWSEEIEENTYHTATYRSNKVSFNENEQAFIRGVQMQPEVDWAIENSFDGIYIHRIIDPAKFATRFKFAVYMTAEHCTFWKLKYA